MRLWTLHPRYLDARGLVALWREALLAQAVLRGDTRGYRRHPQLVRFRGLRSPTGAIAAYLHEVHAESLARGYQFDGRKVNRAAHSGRLTVTRGQLEYEWEHLMRKLALRDPQWRARMLAMKRPRPHPLFRVVRGSVEHWERT
jgi:hypothetical protein